MISKEELHDMYWDEGMTQREIADVFGVSQWYITNKMMIYKIESRTLSEYKKVNLSKLSKNELYQMYYNKHMSQQEIGKSIGVSNATISQWMMEYGIKTRLSSLSKLSEEFLKELYCDNEMTSIEIADEFGVSQQTILNWIKSYGIVARTRFDYTGENANNWRGGISSEPYCFRFNNQFKEAVRERDDYTCQLCGFEQNCRKLDVHHVHYDKENCYPDVVTLCRSCNSKVNGDRDYWEEYFENQLIERGLYCWSLST